MKVSTFISSMLLARFWYLVLAAIAGVGIAAALLAQGTFNRMYDASLSDALGRDRFEVEAMLKLDARARIDSIAPIASHPDVRSVLKRASSRKDIDRRTKKRLAGRLDDLNRQLAGFAGDALFAVDNHGVVVAQIGTEEPAYGSSFGSMPLVAKAVSGYLRDDVWVYRNAVYRMAARPVVDGGQYVGAIVHGKKMDEQLATLLANKLDGASVAFFLGTRVMASHMPAETPDAPGRNRIEAALKAGRDIERIAGDGRSDPVPLDDARAVYSLFAGSAAHAGAGYVIARPRRVLTTPAQLFNEAKSEDVSALPWVWLVLLPLVLFGVGTFFLWLERDRPFAQFAAATDAMANGKLDRMRPAEYGGGFRPLAETFNRMVDRTAEGAGSGTLRKPADLDAILGPEPEGAPSNSFFGFATQAASPDDEVPSIPPAPGAAGAATAPIGLPPAAPVPSPAKQVSGIGKPPPPPPPAARSSSSISGFNLSMESGLITEESYAGPTVVTQMPEYAGDTTANNLLSDDGAEDRHYRQVFEEFVATNKQCGQPIQNLTYEKFLVTLRKTRDQIVQNRGVRRVRFTVYVKEGKAALKATPIRE